MAALLSTLALSSPVAGRFSEFGKDIEQPGVLKRVVEQVAVDNEIVLVSGDGSSYASPMALNTVLQFNDLGHRNVLYLSDSPTSCAHLREGVPDLNCVWSSRIPTTRPPHNGLCVKKHWDMRFFFYDLRKDLLYRLAVEYGVNVLQTDTDVVWLASPYPLLKSHFANHTLVVQRDAPLVNAGVVYVQNVRKGAGAAWLLQELARRVHLFLWNPEAVAEHVPWAQRPFFANADEQTLMNDVLVSSIGGEVTYAGSTAFWEIRQGSTRGVDWEKTREKHQYDQLMAKVHKSRTNIAETPPSDPAWGALCAPRKLRHDMGSWYPLHVPGGPTSLASSYAAAPSWLFAHYPADSAAWQASGHSAEQPPLCAEGGAAALQQQQQEATQATARSRPPYVMLHMAGIRSGAWHRRALLRAHGWWHPQADTLMAAEARWARRGTLSLAWGEGAASALPALAPRSLDTLVANLLLLGTLSNRVAVVPDVACPAAHSAEAAVWGKVEGVMRLARVHQGGVGGLLPADRCAWTPPVHDACLRVQLRTSAEHAHAHARAAAPPADERPRCAAHAASTVSDGLPPSALAKLSPTARHGARKQAASTALLPATAVEAGGAASALLASLLRMLACLDADADVTLTPAMLAAVGATPSELAARPLVQRPAVDLTGEEATAQDATDASCVQHLLDGLAA